jgi:hypothetical protein
MAKAIDIVKLKVAECDAILEVRDARVCEHQAGLSRNVISTVLNTGSPHVDHTNNC